MPLPVPSRALFNRLTALLVAAIALIATLVSVPTAAFAADPELSVTWPEVTNFNPNATPYVFEVHNGGDDLYAQWQGLKVAVPGDGEFTVPFDHGGTGSVDLKHCTDTVCSAAVATSPALTLVTGLEVFIPQDILDVSAQRPPTAHLHVSPSGSGPLTVEWSINRYGTNHAVQTGTTQVAPTTDPAIPAQEIADLVLPLSGEIPTGTYELQATVSTTYPERPAYGTLTGTATLTLKIDSVIGAPKPGGLPSTFYPVVDGYQDTLRITYVGTDDGNVAIDVANASGRVVRRLTRVWLWADGAGADNWDGTDEHGRIVPEGTYEIRYTATDEAQNTATVTRKVSVSRKKLTLRTWTRTVSAQQPVMYKYAGRCSTLAKTGRGRTKGSLSFRSMTKCRKTSRGADVVMTENGMYVPKSPVGRYGTVQLTMDGAPRSGSVDQAAGRPYLALAYYRATDNEPVYRVFARKSGKRTLKAVSAPSLLYYDKKKAPYVAWLAGLSQGSRFDVRSYTVRFTYYVLA